MRKALHTSLLLAGTVVLLHSCTKLENSVDNPETLKVKPSQSSCQALSFKRVGSTSGDTRTIFSKTIDPLTGKPNRIQAGIYEGGDIIDSINFNIIWKENTVAFTVENSPADTVLVATIDKNGLVTSVRQGNAPNFEFLPTSFQYKDGKISVMKISFGGTFLVSKFTYDSKGNLVRILDNAVDGQTPARVDYKYNLSEKAYGQAYHDEARGFSWNTYSLLEFLGAFPGNQPVNLRTRTTVTWEDNYVAYDYILVNHKLDGQKKLISYDVADPVTDKVTIRNQIEWSCGNGDNNQLQ